MSMTSELVNRLKRHATMLKNESTNRGTTDMLCIKDMLEAADTIKELSLKLHNSQMERSSQYYHGGWIPADERLPETQGYYLATLRKDIVRSAWFDGKSWSTWGVSIRVVAWMPLPSSYKESED